MKQVLLVAMLAILASCGQTQRLQDEFVGGTGIIGGTEVSENSAMSFGIVGIYDTSGNSICTGSLITPNVVLTAAHCVMAKPSKLKIVFGNNVDEMISAREQDIIEMYTRRATDVKVHPSYSSEETEDEVSELSDIALIKFRGDLPPGYNPVPLLADDSVLRRGVMVTVAGFGVSQVDVESVDARKVRNLEEALEYGEVVCDDSLKNCLRVEMSGDGQLRETQAPISFVQETEVYLDESKGHGTCSGDSGGPAYVEIENQLYLFGITSRGSPLCNSVGIYTNAVSYIDWIKATMPTMR